MKKQNNPDLDNHLFTYFAAFWLCLGWLGFILSLAGIFQAWIFGLYLLSGGAFFFHAIFRRQLPARFSREFKIVIVIALATVILFSFFTTPTIFSGRDQGSISEAAIRLAQNRQLEFSTPASAEFFKIYGPGRALNFPGFHYLANGHLITQFPLPYIAWLGIFYALLGLPGLIVANAVLFFIFLLSFYLLGKIFLEKKIRFTLLAAIIFSFSFSWFFKFTLSENLALTLLWFGILQFTHFVKNREAIFLTTAFFAFGLLAFSRIEGLAIFAMFALALLTNKDCRAFLSASKINRIYLPLLFLLAMGIWTVSVNFPFFKEVGKALLKNPGLVSQNDSPLATLHIFYLYGLLPFALGGLAGIVYFLKKKNYFGLLPFFLTLPTFFYLLNPHISQDHPWLLRRFVFAVLPALIFYALFWLSVALRGKKKNLLPAAIILLLLLNFPAFAKYFTFSENPTLLAQTESLSRKFSATDLVLVDRWAAGDNFSMLTGPLNFLYGKNAVYFFNPDDFAKLNLTHFSKIYLLAPAEKTADYENSALGKYLSNSTEYSIITQRLISSKTNPFALPEIQEIQTVGKIFNLEQ